mmetsp:Transcript_34050/g.47431  ORF Transcript_34050/g.47431 Transcript_34050/m.47431 type:complete len:139 (-) Transcript_34050:206-622(-)
MGYTRDLCPTNLVHAVTTKGDAHFLEFHHSNILKHMGRGSSSSSSHKSSLDSLIRDLPEKNKQLRDEEDDSYDIFKPRTKWPPDPEECHPEFPNIPYKKHGDPIYKYGSEKETRAFLSALQNGLTWDSYGRRHDDVAR